jgi:hypothetical protein
MTRKEQRQFIEELTDRMKVDILHRVHKIPENWDGVELRWWIAEIYGQGVISSAGLRGRKKDYNNDVLVNNLT